MKLSELISKSTKTVEAPAASPSVEAIIKDKAAEALIATSKPTELKKEEIISEDEIKLAGEINTNLFFAGIETPLILYNSIAAKKKSKKAKQQLKGDQLVIRLKEIADWKKDNEKVIYADDTEFDRLKKAFTQLARLNKGKPHPTLMIFGAIVSSVTKRIEIFVE